MAGAAAVAVDTMYTSIIAKTQLVMYIAVIQGYSLYEEATYKPRVRRSACCAAQGFLQAPWRQ